MEQLVSVLIPAHNASKWISECIESALNQSWSAVEVIVVDDGSLDDTFQIASRYASSRVRVVKQKNKGACAARNRAFQLSKGQYIQWLDADDLLAPEKLEKQLANAGEGRSFDILVSGAWGHFYRDPALTRFVWDPLWEDLEPTEWLFRKVDQNLWMPPAAFVVSRRLVEAAGPWDENLFRDNDGEYFSRILLSASFVRFVSESKVFKRRTRGISSDTNLTDRKLTSLCESLTYYVSRLLAMEDSPRTRRALLRLLDRWFVYFYPERPDLCCKIEAISADLGAPTIAPVLQGKYHYIQKVLGWRLAKKIKNHAPLVRSSLEVIKEQYASMKRKGETR